MIALQVVGGWFALSMVIAGFWSALRSIQKRRDHRFRVYLLEHDMESARAGIRTINCEVLARQVH